MDSQPYHFLGIETLESQRSFAESVGGTPRLQRRPSKTPSMTGYSTVKLQPLAKHKPEEEGVTTTAGKPVPPAEKYEPVEIRLPAFGAITSESEAPKPSTISPQEVLRTTLDSMDVYAKMMSRLPSALPGIPPKKAVAKRRVSHLDGLDHPTSRSIAAFCDCLLANSTTSLYPRSLIHC